MMQPGTKLGIAAAQLAQQGQYKPFTSDGKPTVVNNLITQESQKEAAQQAQIAGQIQAERERKMAEAIRQMAAQQATQGGIASLPNADVNMAEGGVVGYNGQESSSVKSQAEEDREKILGVLTAIRDKGLLPAGAAIADVASAIPRGLLGAYNSAVIRPMRAAGIPAGYIPDIMGGDYSSATPFYDRFVRGEQTSPPSQSSSSQYKGKSGIADEDIGAPEAPKKARPPGQGVAQTRPTPPSATAPMLPDTRESTAVNPSQSDLIYAQQRGALRDLAERLGKPIQKTPEELAYQKAALEEYQRGIGAIDAAAKRFAEMQKTRDSRNLADFFASAGGAGSMFAGLTQAQRRMSPILAAREEQDIIYQDKLGERRNAVESLRLANIKQDADAARAAADKLRTIDLELNKLGLGLGEARMKDLSALERTQAEIAGRATEGALDRASREKIEGQKLKLHAEQNGQMKLANLLNASNITVSSAIEKMERALDKKYGAMAQTFRMMPKSELQKNPELAASYEEYKKESEKMYDDMVAPAIAERNRLAAQVGGGGVQRYDAQGNLVK